MERKDPSEDSEERAMLALLVLISPRRPRRALVTKQAHSKYLLVK